MSTTRRFVLVEPEQWDEMRRKRKYHEDPHEKRLVDADRQLEAALAVQPHMPPAAQRQDIADKLQQVQAFRSDQQMLVPLPPITNGPFNQPTTPSSTFATPSPMRQTPASITAARRDYYGILHPEYNYASTPETVSSANSSTQSTPRANNYASTPETVSSINSAQSTPRANDDVDQSPAANGQRDILSSLAPRIRERAQPILKKLLTMPQFGYDPVTSTIILNGQQIPQSNITNVLRRMQVTIPSAQKKLAGYNEIVHLLAKHTDMLPSTIVRSPAQQKLIAAEREKIPNRQLFASVSSLP